MQQYSRMDVELLRTFITLAETLHFGRCAKRVHSSPSTVSRMIKRIEEELGDVPLFERDNRNVTLTPEGEEFCRYAKEAVKKWQDIQNSFHKRNAVIQGDVSIFSSVTGLYTLFPDILRKIQATYPLIKIKLVTGNAEDGQEHALKGRYDIALGIKPAITPSSLLYHEMIRTSLQFIISREGALYETYEGKASLPWSQLPLIVPKEGHARKLVLSWFHARGIEPVIAGEASDHEAMTGMVRLGIGVGVVSKLALQRSSLSKELHILSVIPPLPTYTGGVYLLKRKEKLPHIAAVWDIILRKDAEEAYFVSS